MTRVFTVTCIMQGDIDNRKQVTIAEHEHPQIAEALKDGSHVESVTPTVSGDGRFVTLTFVLKKR